MTKIYFVDNDYFSAVERYIRKRGGANLRWVLTVARGNRHDQDILREG